MKWDEHTSWFVGRHIDDGAQVLSDVMGWDVHELVAHCIEDGIDIRIRPLAGDVCPCCGRRMTPHGKGWRSGLCEACYTRRRREVSSAVEAELAEARLSDHWRRRGG